MSLPLFRGVMDWYAPRDQKARDRKRILLGNYAFNTYNNLINGSFLTGLLLILHADEGTIGLIATIPSISSLLQLLSPMLLERFATRKKILICMLGISIFLQTMLIGLIPLFPIGERGKILTVTIALFLANGLYALQNPGMSALQLPSIQENVRPSFYSFSTMTMNIIALSVSLLAGEFLDWMKAAGVEYKGILVLRIIALAMGVINLYQFARIREYPYLEQQESLSLRQIVSLVVREKQYGRTVLIIFLYQMIVSIPGNYYMLYLINDLQVGYGYISLVNLLSIPIVIFITPLWKRIVQRRGWTKSLYFAMILVSPYYLGLAFTQSHSRWLYLAGNLWSFFISPTGITLALQGLPYWHIPEKHQTVYLSVYLVGMNIASVVGIFWGKCFMNWTQGLEITILQVPMGNKQLLVLMNAGLILLAAVAIRLLAKEKRDEEGENASKEMHSS